MWYSVCMSGTPGRSGRKPKSTLLKKAEGDRGKRLGGLEAVAEPSGKVVPPDWMTASAMIEWRRLAEEHEKIGILTASDVQTFALYCQTVADLARARAELEEAWVPGWLKSAKTKPPILVVIQSLSDQIHKLASSLGMTPQARGGMAVKTSEPQKKLEDFAKSKGKK